MDNRIAQVEIIIYKIVNNVPFFLLLKRIPARGGFWQAVTGGVNPGENLIKAAKREVFEETQITDYLNFIDNVYYFEFNNDFKKNIKEYVFGAEINNNINIKLSNEHSEKRWCRIEEALQLLKYKTNQTAIKKPFNLINEQYKN